ncbi:hypothetical protein [Streptomyces humidus]|uniref:hypothetical protein n=1 Tax=Streptomyces humidus TaxID=52259 RepID=UPI001E5B9D91|nr:hypothetical protein [Streptomyces humidus]
MNGIEFFHYPFDGGPSLAWGVRVDGVDLRAHTAWATRELWRPELEDQFEDQERESAELIWRQHDGLAVVDVAEPPFLRTAGRIPLLGCPCGIPRCWPLTARVETSPVTVTWSAFRQTERERWGDLPVGPFVFGRTAYEAALSSPAALTADPPAPVPAGLGV